MMMMTFIRKSGHDVFITRSFIHSFSYTLLALLAVRANFEGTPEVNESCIASEQKYEWRIVLELDIDGEKCSQELSK